ncbi:Late-stage biofilm-induced protein [Candida albicans P75016]|nr:Late-stage biofilm-induced protein [Candida albicans P75016]
MSQVNLLEFQDYLLYSESLNILIESEFSSMSSDTTAFQPPPTKAPEAPMDSGTIPKRSPARLFQRWISSSSSSKDKPVYAEKALLKKQNIAPEPIKITKQQVPAKQIGTSEPSSPLSVASSHDNSCSDSSAASIFSDSKNNNSMQMLLTDDIEDILEDIDDAEIYDAEKVTITYISSKSC